MPQKRKKSSLDHINFLQRERDPQKRLHVLSTLFDPDRTRTEDAEYDLLVGFHVAYWRFDETLHSDPPYDTTRINNLPHLDEYLRAYLKDRREQQPAGVDEERAYEQMTKSGSMMFPGYVAATVFLGDQYKKSTVKLYDRVMQHIRAAIQLIEESDTIVAMPLIDMLVDLHKLAPKDNDQPRRNRPLRRDRGFTGLSTAVMLAIWMRNIPSAPRWTPQGLAALLTYLRIDGWKGQYSHNYDRVRTAWKRELEDLAGRERAG